MLFPDRPGVSLPLPTVELVKAMKRDLTIGDATGAGNLAFTGAMAVANAARPSLVLDRAGVPRMTLLEGSADVSFPAFDPEVSPGGWCGEGSNGSEINLLTRSATASPRQAFAYVEITRRLRQSVDNLESVVLGELVRAVRQVVETGFLQGSGSESQPLGLCSMVDADTDAQEVNWGGSVPTLAEINDQMDAFLSAHGSYANATWFSSSALAVRMLETEVVAQSGRFVADANFPNGLSIQGRPLFTTDCMPAGTLLLLDPSTIRQVWWGTPAALLDRFSDNRDLRGDSQLVVYNLCDVVSLFPAQVVVGR